MRPMPFARARGFTGAFFWLAATHPAIGKSRISESPIAETGPLSSSGKATYCPTPFARAGESTGAFFSLGATRQPSENDSPASLLRALKALSPIVETGPSLSRLPPDTSRRASEGLLSVADAENLSHRLLDTQHERFERSSSRPKAHRRRLKAGASQR